MGIRPFGKTRQWDSLPGVFPEKQFNKANNNGWELGAFVNYAIVGGQFIVSEHFITFARN